MTIGRGPFGVGGSVPGGGSGFPEPISLTGATDGQFLKRSSGVWVPASIADTNLTTAETDTSKVLAPDGTGGVHWAAGGGGSSPLTTKGDLWGFTTVDARVPVSGHDGYVLTEDSGAAAGVSWQAGGSGALVLLEQHTASGSATLDFTTAISATYDEYLIELVNLIPATNGVNLLMRMSTDGGATYDSGANYSYSYFGWNAGGSAAGGNTGQTSIQIGGNTIVNTATWGMVGSLRLFSPGSTALYKQIEGSVRQMEHTSSLRVGNVVHGVYEVTTAVNAVRFLMSSGNISSGVIRVYGISR